MATKKKAATEKPAKSGRKTKAVSVWLDPEQEAWLKIQPKGISITVRALVTEAINLENLVKSVKKRKR